MIFIDTHIHIDGTEFDNDRQEVIQRARQTGVSAMLVPAIDLQTAQMIQTLCQAYPGYLYPMIGLHPEEVKADYATVIEQMREMPLDGCVAIGEVGLDFYWSREFEKEQLEAFELQVQWACETKIPLMIHCRKAQNEMVKIMRKYRDRLCGGVFHCFTGNEHEARELLEFDGFALGIGGVLTFKKSNLPLLLPKVPLERIVLETDAPYMAPVPMRGKRNESAFLTYVIQKMAECYNIPAEKVAETTTDNAKRIFRL